jgi:hypothetical protein
MSNLSEGIEKEAVEMARKVFRQLETQKVSPSGSFREELLNSEKVKTLAE